MELTAPSPEFSQVPRITLAGLSRTTNVLKNVKQNLLLLGDYLRFLYESVGTSHHLALYNFLFPPGFPSIPSMESNTVEKIAAKLDVSLSFLGPQSGIIIGLSATRATQWYRLSITIGLPL